jgi:signal peptidase II
LAWMFATLVLATILDLGSKEWAIERLSRVSAKVPDPICQADERGRIAPVRLPFRMRTVVPSYLELRYAENCGAAFSMLRTAPRWVRLALLVVLNGLACVGLIVLFARGHGGRLFALAVPLIVSGAVGNIADRLRHGFVVDFIRLRFGSWEYPTFNVADIAIAVGMLLWLIESRGKPWWPSRRPALAPGA